MIQKNVTLHMASGDKFLPEFIDFVNGNFNKEEHLFLILRSRKSFFIRPGSNIIFLDDYSSSFAKYKIVKNNLKNCSKVIFHGFFNINLILFFSLNFRVLKKCIWVIWGGDLYVKYSDRNRVFESFLNLFRKFIFGRLGAVVSFLVSDYAYAKKKFGVKAPHLKSFVYLSNLFRGSFSINGENSHLNILIGNSATKSNNHFDAFCKIKKSVTSENYTVFAPLSYGNRSYSDEVVRLGRSLFGDKFVPLLDFMNKSSYEKFLEKIDIAIFNHDRQQALGNTIQLLGLGKKVYLKKNVSQFKEFKSLGVKIFDVDSLELSKIDSQSAKSNHDLIVRYFSEEKLRDQLEEIFNYKF